MSKASTFSIHKGLWFFHPIGAGVIFTYSNNAKQVIITSEATGVIIKTIDMSKVGGYKTHDHFKQDSLNEYMSLIENKINLNHELMDDPTILETPLGGVGIDLNIIKN